MADSALSPRHHAILQHLNLHGATPAAALAAQLGVSVQTLRSDLRRMEDDGLIRRRHGQACAMPPSENIGYHPRRALAEPEKARIGAAVARLIPEGARLAIGTGTTAEACARALAGHRGLRVFTNNLHAVQALHAAPGIEITLPGGPVRLRDLDMIGAETAEFFAGLRLDFSVFSLGGISADGALLDFNMDEIRARRALNDCAETRILVADSGKFGRAAPHSWGRLSGVDWLVCGAPPPPLLAEELRAAGRRLLLA